MRPVLSSVLIFATFLVGCAALPAQNTQLDFDKIINTNRPAADIERDTNRKPVQMLEFAKVRAGQKIVDYVPGTGYFTRLFSNAVGPNGRVYSLTPQLFIDRFTKGIVPNIASENGHMNNIGLASGAENLNIPQNIDVFWTAQNYHDVRIYLGEQTTAKLNQSVYNALKPNGYYVILDHSGAPNLSEDDIKKLHRIDVNTVIREVESAGFVLDGRSDVLKNPSDNLSLNVFDPAIRAKTDQFILRFKKPNK